MQKLICALLLLIVLIAVAGTPSSTQAKVCTSTSVSGIQNGCAIKTWTVCCDGPEPGEVSCFTYVETLYCPNL